MTSQRGVPPTFLPADETWAEYYRQLFPNHTKPSTGMSAWRYATTAVDAAESLWRLRQQARRRWLSEEHQSGIAELVHVPVVLWSPRTADPACLGCRWIGGAYGDPAEAAKVACEHAIAHGEVAAVVQQVRVPISERNGECFNPSGRRWVDLNEERS